MPATRKQPKGKTASSGLTNPLPSLIRASAWDAGNAHMRAAGRTIWSASDRRAACDEQERLIRNLFSRDTDTDPREAYCRFGYAETMEKAGMLSLSTKDFHGELDRSYGAYVASLSEAA